MSDDLPLNSRYRFVAPRAATLDDGREVEFLGRRIIPAPERFRAIDRRRCVDGDRLDQFADAAYGDALLYWRLADANAVEDVLEGCRPAGRALAIVAPLEISGDG